MNKWILAVSLSMLVLGGCASQNKNAGQTGSVEAPAGAEAAWKQRQAQFARMSSWRMQGKVGVQFRDESASFGISWLQQGNGQYEMNIKNPLTGSIVAYLKGSPSSVTLQADGKTYQDSNAEQLLQSQMGVSLPLEGMKYWVRGVPSPDSPVDKVELDDQGRPKMLQQAGWVMEYTGWQGNDSNALPEKLSLTRAAESTKVKVIAKDWQTRY